MLQARMHSATYRIASVLLGLVPFALLLCGCAVGPGPGSTHKNTPLSPATPIVMTWSNGTQSGLMAVSGYDGAVRWRNEMGAPILPSVFVGGVLFAIVGHTGSAGQDVVAVRASDGSILWRIPLPNGVTSTTLATDGTTVAVDADQQGLFVLDAATGALCWRHVGEASGMPAVRDGVVYASLVADPLEGAQRPTGLSAFRASDGMLLWTTEDVDHGRIAANSSAVYGGVDITTPITATRSSDGKRLWQSKNAFQILSVTDTMLLVTAPLTALDPQDGHILWQTSGVGMTTDGNGTLPSSGGNIYGPYDNSVTALRLSDGTRLWRVKPSDYANSDYSIGSLFVESGVVFALLEPTPHDFCFSDCNPRLVALDGATGAVYWEQDATNERLLPEQVAV